MVAWHASLCAALGVDAPLWPHVVAAVAAAARPFRGSLQQQRSPDVAHRRGCAANGLGRLSGTWRTHVWR